MQIRASKTEDIPAIMAIYDKARAFMEQTGNPTQWGDGYPKQELIEDDLRQEHSYVCVNEGRIVGTFTLIFGDDPTYQLIEDGEWHSERPYGAIHRVASDGTAKGVAGACFDFCKEKIDYLRIDTHEANKPMQAAILRYGFQKCGVIYTRDGSPRIAFDYLVK